VSWSSGFGPAPESHKQLHTLVLRRQLPGGISLGPEIAAVSSHWQPSLTDRQQRQSLVLHQQLPAATRHRCVSSYQQRLTGPRSHQLWLCSWKPPAGTSPWSPIGSHTRRHTPWPWESSHWQPSTASSSALQWQLPGGISLGPEIAAWEASSHWQLSTAGSSALRMQWQPVTGPGALALT
jgi:hypothetical protein